MANKSEESHKKNEIGKINKTLQNAHKSDLEDGLEKGADKAPAEVEKATKLHYFYVLACSDNTLYTGYTTDPDRREMVHNQGKGAKYTQAAGRRPVHMVYSKPFTSKSRAMSAEYRFKQLTRRQKEAFLSDKGVKRVWPPSAWADRVDDSVEGGLPFLPEEEKGVKDEE